MYTSLIDIGLSIIDFCCTDFSVCPLEAGGARVTLDASCLLLLSPLSGRSHGDQLGVSVVPLTCSKPSLEALAAPLELECSAPSGVLMSRRDSIVRCCVGCQPGT